ncbi:MAG: hypothetical protein IJL32_09100 [Oscillospiraceae bacterium]|nr:hypothetical protein [Oscillospiraceae bacterium]
MKKSDRIIAGIASVGAFACGVSFLISLFKVDNLIAQIAFGASCLFCTTTAIAAIKMKD